VNTMNRIRVLLPDGLLAAVLLVVGLVGTARSRC
jgi:hypothetical protein